MKKELFYVMTILMALLVFAGFMSCSSDDDVIQDLDDISEVQHEYVDLGLPSGTLWATCNVGASKPEDYGDYFAWGETNGKNGGKSKFDWSTYKYCKGSYKTITKYCTNSSYGVVDDKTELEAMDDAATANWGSAWQMPSKTQYAELINNTYTTREWTTINGIKGMKITSKINAKSVFFPAAGYYGTSSLYSVGSCLICWSRSLSSSGSYYGYELSSSDDGIIQFKDEMRSKARSVRPVRVQK